MSSVPLVFITAALIASTAVDQDPPSEEVRKLIEGYREAAVRTNGVKLTITAELDNKNVKKQVPIFPSVPNSLPASSVKVTWSIDYDGPRFPLNILKPSLESTNYKQTLLLFFVIGEDGKATIVPIHAEVNAIPGIPLPPSRDCYLTLKTKKDVGKGTLAVDLSEIVASARKLAPKQFPNPLPKAIYVQLRHNPVDRGTHLNLDAWTGNLQTELVPVSLKGIGK